MRVLLDLHSRTSFAHREPESHKPELRPLTLVLEALSTDLSVCLSTTERNPRDSQSGTPIPMHFTPISKPGCIESIWQANGTWGPTFGTTPWVFLNTVII